MTDQEPQDLNRRCAERMGYTNIDKTFGWIPADSIGDLPIMVTLPSFTTDLNAAFQLVDKLEESQYHFSLHRRFIAGLWQASFTRFGESPVSAMHEDRRVAICVAFLAATDNQPKP